MNMQRRLVSMVLALSVLCAGEGPVTATTWIEKKLLASDGVSGDIFGWSADIWGDYAVVGAPLHQVNGVISNGAAYIFKRNAWGQWLEIQKITPPAPTTRFGTEVAISGDFVAVLIVTSDAYPDGAVYMYQRSGSFFSYMTTIEPSDPHGDSFDGIDLDGGRLIIADPGNSYIAQAAGRAHIYRPSNGTWVLEASIAPSTLSAGDLFGSSVAISGNLAIVGAEGDDDMAPFSGAAYVYEWNGSAWLLRDKLKSISAATDEGFGFSLSIDNSGRVAVGAIGDDTNGINAGATYLFERTGNSWTHAGKVTAGDGQAGDYFGYDVDYRPSELVVGSREDDAGRGGLYVYEVQNPPTKLVPAGLGPDDAFGHLVAKSGYTILASAPADDDNGQTAGAAFIFERDDPWPQWNLYLSPWPYIYIYRGCGRTPQDVALTFKLNTDRGVSLTYDTLQPPENGKLVWDTRAQTVTYVPAAGFVGDDGFRVSAWDADGNRNELVVDVLVEAKSR